LYPSLYESVKEKILDGKFQPVGGSWVENDTNMPSGEALVRQVLFGQRYFEAKFGKRCETAWLPDSFGYSGSLPQIIRGAGMQTLILRAVFNCFLGMKYFFTQKMSWYVVDSFVAICSE
jgi:alpha-mannosidase